MRQGRYGITRRCKGHRAIRWPVPLIRQYVVPTSVRYGIYGAIDGS